jgi:hypothetical protein
MPHGPTVEVDHLCVPENWMHSVAGYMNTLTSAHCLTMVPRNAQFTPRFLLRMPELTRVYRFVFPTLAVTSFERAFLFDVRTGSQIQTLEGIQTIPLVTGSEVQEHEQTHASDSFEERGSFLVVLLEPHAKNSSETRTERSLNAPCVVFIWHVNPVELGLSQYVPFSTI